MTTRFPWDGFLAVLLTRSEISVESTPHDLLLPSCGLLPLLSHLGAGRKRVVI